MHIECIVAAQLSYIHVKWDDKKKQNLASQSFPTAWFFNNNIETIFYYFSMDFIKKTGAHLSFKYTP